MTVSDGLQIYGAALTTLVILATTIRYLISSKINPIEDDVVDLKKEDARISDLHKEYSGEIDELKQALVDEVKEISQGNFDFRLKYEGAISEIKLLLAEKYVTKVEVEKELEDIKNRIEHNTQIRHEVKSIRKSIESIEGKK